MCLGLTSGSPLCYLPFPQTPQLPTGSPEGGLGVEAQGRGDAILVPSLRVPSVWLYCCFPDAVELTLLEALKMTPFFWEEEAVMVG